MNFLPVDSKKKGVISDEEEEDMDEDEGDEDEDDRDSDDIVSVPKRRKMKRKRNESEHSFKVEIIRGKGADDVAFKTARIVGESLYHTERVYLKLKNDHFWWHKVWV